MDNNTQLAQQLTYGLKQLALSIDEDTQAKLLAFMALILKWNKVYNLTAITVAEDMLKKHILDSLAVLPYLNTGRIIDVGTGAGLPGIPLALCRPQQPFFLLDSSEKRQRFLMQVITELKIDNVTLINERVEQYQPDQGYDVVLTRAFSSVTEMLEKCRHLCCTDGEFLAMKGKCPEEELQTLPEGIILREIIELQVPGLQSERHLISMTSG